MYLFTYKIENLNSFLKIEDTEKFTEFKLLSFAKVELNSNYFVQKYSGLFNFTEHNLAKNFFF